MAESAETIFSLKEGLPAAQEGSEPDESGDLQPGSLGRGSLREICFIAKITAQGALVRVGSAVAVGERLDLALMTGEALSGTVEWVAQGEARIRFDEEADIFALIARNLVRQPGDNRRMPRIELRVSAMVRAGSRRDHAMTLDVSDGGACIETNLPLVPMEHLTLAMDGFRPMEAVVRWVHGKRAGLAFVPGLAWHELMPWLKQRHRRRPSPRIAAVNPQAVVTPIVRADPEPEPGIGLNLAARVRDGHRRWMIEIVAIDTHEVRFTSYAALEPGRLFWISLPGLEGWPARIMSIDGYTVTCLFTQPLHPAVLDRILSEQGTTGSR